MNTLAKVCWEYIRLSVNEGDKVIHLEPQFFVKTYLSLYEDGKPWIVDLMYVMGRDGWELAAIEPAEAGDRYYHFKRQKEG